MERLIIIVYNRMPVKVRKLPLKKLYKVYNPLTKKVYAKGTTKKKAETMKRILGAYKLSKVTQ